ncbi:MAG: Uma2 family endonuclease [Phycisphaerales bacterium]|nr:Uma2 family endonuclease [Phycisphaerales bacterium]
MSAIRRIQGDFGYAGLRMTAEEYIALGESDAQYQLIDGVVVMSPSATPRHQVVAHLIASAIEDFAQHALGLRVIPDVDLLVGPTKVYQPDIVVYGPGRLKGIPSQLTTPPDLIIEVLSPGSMALDLITKRDDYERFGVGEYWAVDPDPVNARVWRRSGSQLLEQGVHGDVVECQSIPGVRVDMARVRLAVGPA